MKTGWRSGAVMSLSALLLLSQSAFAFTDVPNNYWANQFIDYLSGRSVITGYPDNSFKPNKPVTRAEFAVMLAKSQGLTATGSGSAFTDVPANHWAAQAIRAVAGQGWIAGYPGGRFLPNQNISMAEMYTILAKAANQPSVSAAEADSILAHFQDGASVPAWARIPVASAVKAGISVDELSANHVYPVIQATRASVATSVAKLVNPSFRDGLAGNPGTTPPTTTTGQAVNVTGTLQATATPGEWVVVAANGNRYYVVNPSSALTSQSWFRVGNEVVLTGNIDTQASSTNRQVVNLSNLVAVQNPQSQVVVTGSLLPSTTTQGAWLVQTPDNKLYRILNMDAFNNSNLIRYGNTVTVTGTLRPDVTLPASEGSALVASKLDTAQTSNQISVKGTLQPTTEAGGWMVTDPATGNKYVLLGADASKNQTWFKSGNEVLVQGSVRSDIPSIYQEGPVLVVSQIAQAPGSVTGTEQVGLYFPNLINIVRDPATMLGNPTQRTFTGPSIPQQAIQALLQGPSDVERVQGFYVDNDVKKLTLDQFNVDAAGNATVVLEAPANFAFQNATIPQRLDEQLTRTLSQFPGIKQVGVAVRGPNNTVIWSSTP